jgi:hypothetical protein
MMARAPVPGAVKTRLAAAVGAAAAAALYRAFTEDLCAAFAPRHAMALACTPDTADPFFARLARRYRLTLLPQGPGDLGARMRRVAATALARAPRVVLIGSDAPTLPVTYVADAFRALRTWRVVLGPSVDGGYYLLGLRAPVPDVFTRMPWGSAEVLRRTLRRLAARAVRPALLPCWYDVDTPADLAALRCHLAVLATLGQVPCPRTRRAVVRLDA